MFVYSDVALFFNHLREYACFIFRILRMSKQSGSGLIEHKESYVFQSIDYDDMLSQMFLLSVLFAQLYRI